MIELLARLFKIDKRKSTEKRTLYGVLCSIAGIFLNVLLFALKLTAGTVSASIAIIADAFNNLSDAGSSVITLLGFRIAGIRPDPEHPFGHGRAEYISGLAVSFIILIMGFELCKSSFEKIISPENPTFSAATLIILSVSILVKFYMAAYNRSYGRKYDSPAMQAVFYDSLSDCIATAAVLAASVISLVTGVSIDGYCGLAVSAFIIFSGVRAARETISPLLGQPPEKDFVNEIKRLVLSGSNVMGIHDIVIHDYGPGRVMVSLHAEVPADGDLLELHDSIDNIENELKRELSCDAVIHMDPIDTGDAANDFRDKIGRIVSETDGRITFHDLRIVQGKTHTNLIFDIVIPYDLEKTANMSDTEAVCRIRKKVYETMGPNYHCVISVDRDYTQPDVR